MINREGQIWTTYCRGPGEQRGPIYQIFIVVDSSFKDAGHNVHVFYDRYSNEALKKGFVYEQTTPLEEYAYYERVV